MKILSVDGGGYLGLATAAFIGAVEKHFSVAFHDRFDLFCGTSTGAIIALALASGHSGTDLVDLYKTLGSRVFRRSAFRRGFFRPKYSGRELRRILEKKFGDTTLDEVARAEGKNVLVTAFNLTTGTPRVFKTDHSDTLQRDGDLRLVDIALASSAAPTFFPFVGLHNPRDGMTEAYCDGGVVANHPALLGFAEAVYQLHSDPSDIAVLSISTPRQSLAEGSLAVRRLNRGLFQMRSRLAPMLVDSGAQLAHEILKRLVDSYGDRSPAYVRVEMDNPRRFPMDQADDEATSELELIGLQKAAGSDMRNRLQDILGV